MVSSNSGLNFVRGKIRDHLKEQERSTVKKPLVKIVHIDLDVYAEHPDIAGRFDFYVDSDAKAAQKRDLEADRILPMLHGSSCLAILTRAGKLSETDSHFWNLADFAEIYSLPVRLACEIPKGIENEIHSAVLKYVMDVRCVEDTLQILLDTHGERRLGLGDTVVITFALDDAHPNARETNGLFPIIHHPSIAKLVKRITTELKASVVISAGNAGCNLDCADQLRPNWLYPASSEQYGNHGVPCGAVVVGAHSGTFCAQGSNHGTCVDAYGPGQIYRRSSQSGYIEMGIFQNALMEDDDGKIIDLNGRVLSWADTSSAAMYIAALIANVQQYRLCKGYDPVLPYAARAHLRQWQVNSGVAFRGGAKIPDILAWLIGTGVLDADSDEAHSLSTPVRT